MAPKKGKDKEAVRKEKKERKEEKRSAPSQSNTWTYVAVGGGVASVLVIYAVTAVLAIRRKQKLKKLEELTASNSTADSTEGFSDVSLLAAAVPFCMAFGAVLAVFLSRRFGSDRKSRTAQLEAAKSSTKEALELARKREQLTAQQESRREERLAQHAAGEAARASAMRVERQAALERARVMRAKEEEERRRRDAQQAEGPKDEDGWTSRQVRALQEAIVDFRHLDKVGTTRQRWELIEKAVPGQNLSSIKRKADKMEGERQGARAAAAPYMAQPASPSTMEEDPFAAMEGYERAASEDGSEDSESGDDQDEGEKVEVELDPIPRGTRISCAISSFASVATLQVDQLRVLLRCQCGQDVDTALSGVHVDSCERRLWCEKCSQLLSACCRPSLLHQSNSTLCHLDLRHCSVKDVLQSTFLATCSCGATNPTKPFQRNSSLDGNCFSCHINHTFRVGNIGIEVVTASAAPDSKASAGADDDDELEQELRRLRKKASSDPKQMAIQLGSQLPGKGVCKHFKRSFRWLRFACCGRAFPCPVCHEDSGCPAAALGVSASRQLCGKCSFEQPISGLSAVKCDKCSFDMVPKSTAHWQGGAGKRDLSALSNSDSRKFKGGQKSATSKTKTSSNKSNRVGSQGKKSREHKRVFGD